jgi:gamma-glutamylcyclotransferase (GGCT)/AIG2-like uncharacterized protein YtfP
MNTMNIFVYGTLMFDRVWSALIAKRYRKIDAQLAGFKRVCVTGEVYPGLLKADGGIVDGVLVLDVDDTDIRLLDRFEGKFYRRSDVMVSAKDGRLLQAQTYIFRDRYRYMLGNAAWDVNNFSNSAMEAFLAQYAGFIQCQK